MSSVFFEKECIESIVKSISEHPSIAGYIDHAGYTNLSFAIKLHHLNARDWDATYSHKIEEYGSAIVDVAGYEYHFENARIMSGIELYKNLVMIDYNMCYDEDDKDFELLLKDIAIRVATSCIEKHPSWNSYSYGE